MIRLVSDLAVAAAYLEGARQPLDKVRAAVHWAEGQGLGIVHGDYGVVAGLAWQAGPSARVSPLGAVVLAYQPPVARDMPEPAALILGQPIPWVEGLEDGFDRELTGHWLGSVARRRYLEGVEAGMELRFELCLRCACGTRRLKAEPCRRCPAAPEGAR